VGHALDGIHSWPFRKYSATRLIKDLNCEIIGLQEALGFQISRIDKALETYDYFGVGRDGEDDGEHCPIFVDSSKLKVLSSETKWFGATPDVPSKISGSKMNRIYTRARVELQNNEVISMFNTHFDEKSNERRKVSMDQLLQQVDQSIPTILLGDFNAYRSNQIFKEIESFGLRFAHDQNCGGTTNGFSRTTKENPIDHILVSNHFDVVSAEVIRKRVFGMLPSDHWPVSATLRLK